MSRFQVFLVLFAAFLVLPVTHAQEQEKGGSVKTFTVTPVNRPAAILAPNAMVAPPPGPISSSMMKDILAGIGGSEGGTQFVLTSRQPFIDGQGFLTLTLPPYRAPRIRHRV